MSIFIYLQLMYWIINIPCLVSVALLWIYIYIYIYVHPPVLQGCRKLLNLSLIHQYIIINKISERIWGVWFVVCSYKKCIWSLIHIEICPKFSCLHWIIVVRYSFSRALKPNSANGTCLWNPKPNGIKELHHMVLGFLAQRIIK